jgi:hypothetical protein
MVSQASSLPVSRESSTTALARPCIDPDLVPLVPIPYNMGKDFAQLLGIQSWRLAPILSQSTAWPSAMGSEVGPVTRFWQDSLKYTRAMSDLFSEWERFNPQEEKVVIAQQSRSTSLNPVDQRSKTPLCFGVSLEDWF